MSRIADALVEQIQCPECAKLGKDNSKDNLAVYQDGHKHCYSCGYHVGLDGIKQFKSQIENENHSQQVSLPFDVDFSYPKRALAWIGQYELTMTDLLNNNALWSEKYKRLIFPIYDSNQGVIAYQGRYFGEDPKEPKWFGKGDLKNTFNIIGEGDKIALVEDIISAIKVSRFIMAMPLYGSHIGWERFNRLSKLINKETEVLVWLDYDKRSHAVSESRIGRFCGLNVRTVVTDLDPKEIKYEEIVKQLEKT